MNASSQLQATNEVLQKILTAVQGVQEVLAQKQGKEVKEDGGEINCVS